MYCVKCGVKLKEGINVCPLCNTKMIYEENIEVNTSYSNLVPKKRNPNIALASIITTLLLVAIITILVVCLNLYHSLKWGGYVIASVLLFYIIFILPLWFLKHSKTLFVCIDFVSIALFLLYICLKTNGKWFLSFAFPIVVLLGILFVVGIALRRKIREYGFFIFGGLLIALGLFCILIEMFESITFNTRMFKWSLYVVVCTSIFGIFLILCGLIRPLKEDIIKRFYL